MMKAALGFLQRTAMCLEMDMSTADVGGGASISLILPSGISYPLWNPTQCWVAKNCPPNRKSNVGSAHKTRKFFRGHTNLLRQAICPLPCPTNLSHLQLPQNLQGLGLLLAAWARRWPAPPFHTSFFVAAGLCGRRSSPAKWGRSPAQSGPGNLCPTSCWRASSL